MKVNNPNQPKFPIYVNNFNELEDRIIYLNILGYYGYSKKSIKLIYLKERHYPIKIDISNLRKEIQLKYNIKPNNI